MQILQPDEQGFGLISHRALGMLRRLVEKAGTHHDRPRSLEMHVNGMQNGHNHANGASSDQNGVEDDDPALSEEGAEAYLKGDPIPHRETVLGALLMPNTDKGILKLLCQLYDSGGA